VSLCKNILNISEKITHVPEYISSSENKKESTVFACFALRQVQNIRQVSPKSLLETQISQMYIDESVNAVYFAIHQTVSEVVMLQVSWSRDET
jgi:hypothetical protein